MDKQIKKNRKQRILQAIYGSSLGVSTAVLAVVAAVEIFMVYYAVANSDQYGANLWKYHGFYLSLLAVAIGGMAINFFVQRDLKNRYKALHVAYPLFAIFVFAWALGITWSNWKITGEVNTTVFIAISTVVPLSFTLFPATYAVFAVVADGLMIWLIAQVPGPLEEILYICLFFVLQLVLGVCFLRQKVTLAERIVGAQDVADRDEMTGFGNRHAYEEAIKQLESGPAQADLIYVAIDMNGLKDVNENLGNKAGDELIAGQVECINQCFGSQSKKYRIGGDEFVVLLHGNASELQQRLDAYEQRMRDWSARNGVGQSASYGCVLQSEFPDSSVSELAKLADERMYAAKARYYQTRGTDRLRLTQG